MRRCWVTAVTVIPSGLERSDTDIGPALKRRMIRRRVESPRASRIRSTLPMRKAMDVAMDTLLRFSVQASKRLAQVDRGERAIQPREFSGHPRPRKRRPDG